MEKIKMIHLSGATTYALILGCAIGVGATLMWIDYTGEGALNTVSMRDTSDNYNFIEPLLECGDTDTITNKKYIPFEKELKERILDYQAKNYPGTYLSFYFRDLRNGPWFSNNYQEGFYPASLLKIPILIGYIRWFEIDPTILQKKIKIEGLTDYTQNVKPEKIAEIGREYTAEELLEIMILYSDNNASNNLLMHLPSEIEDEVFATLQVPSPKNQTAEGYKINVKEYANFFRILYNASYLSNAGSEATLELLSRVTFNKGLTGKLPKEIKVAHKFGERIYTEVDQNNKQLTKAQLHDCGIIYYPNNPYLLCIMTRGNSLEELSNMTQDISKMIYDTWDLNRKKAAEKN